MVKVSAVEVPPPGVALNTVTKADPALAMSAARMAAVSCPLLTKVVVRLDPFQRPTEPVTKFEPFTVRVKAAPAPLAVVGGGGAPAGLGLVGESRLTAGTGLLMVKVRELEVPRPGAGLNPVPEAVPPVAMSPAGMSAVNWAPL